MNPPIRRFSAGAALLLLGLSLILAVNLTASPIARANPGVLYAAPAAQGMGDCSDWANACTLQTALTQATSGDEIWVQAGVHYPGAAGNREAAFTLKSGVALYGGFAGTETSRDARDWQTHKTILSGDIDQNDNHGGDYINENASQIVGDNAYHVVTGSGTDSSAVLDGFIITAGQATDGDSNYSGGGMYNNAGSPTLTNVTFSGNSAYWGSGGGMYNSGNPTLTYVTFSGNSAFWDGGGMYNSGNPTLTHVTFSGNSASYGGGMANDSSNPTLINVTFSGNAVSYIGGGMYNYYGSPTLTNVTFSGNSAGGGGGMANDSSNPTLTNVTFSGNSAGVGGGMYNNYSSPTLTNVTFSSNQANLSHGGGMYNYYSSPTLTNVTFSGNWASYDGGMYNESSSPTLKNVIIANTAFTGSGIYNSSGTPFIAYSDIQDCGGSGSWNAACGTDGGGNIDADPRFVDAANGNLRLQTGSPCIDAGDNTAVPAGVRVDLVGNPRFVDIADVPDTGNGTPPIVDMGAYETQNLIFLPLVVRN